MIPKIIHYCWLSGEEYPDYIKNYINTWKQIFSKDTQYILWDKNKYDEIPNKPQWVINAYNNKLWAFVTDYIRQYAVYTYGGWYLDMDMKVYYDFISKYYETDYEFVSGLEYTTTEYGGIIKYNNYVFGVGIQAACFGGSKNNIVCKSVLDLYNSNKFKNYLKTGVNKFFLPLAPHIMAKCLEQFGFIYDNKQQILNDNKILILKDAFPNFDICTKNTVANHMCHGSWRSKK